MFNRKRERERERERETYLRFLDLSVAMDGLMCGENDRCASGKSLLGQFLKQQREQLYITT